MKQLSLFQLLSSGLETVVRNGNPWWRGSRSPGCPRSRRWAFEPVYHRLTRGLAPAIVLRGPRQIGKTTLLTQVVDQLIQDGVDPGLFRLQFDDLGDLKALSMPIVELVEWYTQDVLGETLNRAASEGRPLLAPRRDPEPGRLGPAAQASCRPREGPARWSREARPCGSRRAR